MASPFRLFRKHQKQMLAILTVMAMFAFVFLGQKGCDFGLSSRGPGDPVVVTTAQFGDLRQSDLQSLIGLHRAVLGFLERLLLEANPTAPPEERRQLGQMLEQIYGRSDANGVLDTWLLSQRAKRLGIVVSEQTAINLINALGGDRVALPTIKSIIGNLRLGQRQLVEALRNILLAQRVKNMFAVTTGALTPAQRWDYYQRLRRTATIELAAVPVEKFSADVKDPGDAVLAKFFETHKGHVHDPEQPEPGFREPQKIAFEYFKADVSNFVDPKSVSDAEVQKYYEDHKQQYANASPVFEHKPLPPKPTAPKRTPETKKEAAKSGSQPATVEKTIPVEPKKPATVEKTVPAESKKPAAEPSKKPESSKKDDAGHKSSSLRSGAQFRWAAYLPDKETNPPSAGAAKPASSPKGDTGKPATANKQPAASGAAGSSSASAGASKPAAPPAAPPKTAAVKESPKSEPEKKDVSAALPAKEQEAFKPLEQVKDEIRNSLAQQKAREKILELMTPLRDKFNAYVTAKIHFDQDQKTNPNLPSPQSLDLKVMAKANGLSLYVTEPISRWQASGLDIAKSYVEERFDFVTFAYRSATSFQLNQPTVSETGPRFSPDGSKLLPGDMFLFWKTEDQAEFTPKFSDKGEREKVLQQWKQFEARKQATDEAERLAKKARDEKKPLKDALRGLPGVQVVESKPFSWITIDIAGSQSQLRLKRSSVEGVDEAGPDFMQTVFGAEAGDAVVAMNYAKTSAYVVRIVQFAPPPSMLMKEFETEKPNFDQPGQYNPFPQLAQQDRIRMYTGWMQEIRKQAGFKYTPLPDDQARSRPATPEEAPPMPADMDF